MDTDDTALALGQGPLTDDQMASVQALLRSLEPSQVVWLSRYLLGALCETSLLRGEVRFAEDLAEDAPGQAAETGQRPVTVLFGTDTGHAEQIARRLVREASARGVPVELRSMAE